MKTLISGLFLAVLWSLLSTSLFAQTGDGETPAEESVCDVLADGTPGLFGLCNAYCEAQDCDSYADGEEPHSCNRLLSNFERLATEDDPDMPCEETFEPMCPCWTSEGVDNEFDAGGLGEPLDLCIFNFPAALFGTTTVNNVDVVQYTGVGTVAFFAADGACSYLRVNTSNPLDAMRNEFGLTPEEEELCRFHVTELSMEWDNDGDPNTFCIIIP